MTESMGLDAVSELERREEANAALDVERRQLLQESCASAAAPLPLEQFEENLPLQLAPASSVASQSDSVHSSRVYVESLAASRLADQSVEEEHDEQIVSATEPSGASALDGSREHFAGEQFAGEEFAGSGSAAADEDGEGGMGATATMRYQGARLKVLQEELESLRGRLAEQSAVAAVADRATHEAQQASLRQERTERQLRAALEKEKGASAALAGKVEGLERELLSVRKSLDESDRQVKAAAADVRARDVRLNRALEEVERFKKQLLVLREDREGVGQGAKAEAQKLAAENVRLKKRQAELLLAFRKQNKLIDVLKRQKLHTEAAILLGFSEEEFTRTLELGDK